MPVPNRLVQKSLWYMAGSALSRIVGAALIPIYAYFVPSATLGTFDYAQTVSGIVAPLAFVAIWEAVLRFGLGDDQVLNRMRSLRTAIAFSILMATTAAVFAGLAAVFNAPFRDQILVVGAMVALTGLVQVWQYAARALGQTRLFASSGITGAVVNLLLVLVLVCVFRTGFLGLSVSYCAGQLATVLLVEWRLRLLRTLRPDSIDRGDLRVLLRYSAPLILNLVSLLALSGFGRLLITHELGSAANGQYAFAMKFAILVTTVGGVVSMATLEETVLRLGSAGYGDFFATLLNHLWSLCLAVGVIALVFIKIFYGLLHSSDYLDSLPMVPIFLLYGIFSVLATNFGNAFQAAMKMRNIALTTIAGALVTIVTSILGLRLLGVTGVAIGLALGMGVTMVLRWAASKRMVSYRLSYQPVALFGMYGVVAAVVVFGVPSFPEWLTWCVLAVAVVAASMPAVRALGGLRAIPDV